MILIMVEGSPQLGDANALEYEIAQIEKQLAERRAVLKLQKQSGQISEAPREKETLREIIGERIGTPVPATRQPAASSANSGQAAILPTPVVEPPAYLSPNLKEKVQELVNIAFTQTIGAAIKKSQASNNAALIDAFHDALADELYNYLVERGKLQKI